MTFSEIHTLVSFSKNKINGWIEICNQKRWSFFILANNCCIIEENKKSSCRISVPNLNIYQSSLNILVQVAKLPTKSLQNKPLLWKERIVSGSVMILMDLNEHISLVHEEMKFNIRENTGSFWGKLEMKY